MGFAAFLLGMVGSAYFELQRIFASFAKIRARRRVDKASDEIEEP